MSLNALAFIKLPDKAHSVAEPWKEKAELCWSVPLSTQHHPLLEVFSSLHQFVAVISWNEPQPAEVHRQVDVLSVDGTDWLCAVVSTDRGSSGECCVQTARYPIWQCLRNTFISCCIQIMFYKWLISSHIMWFDWADLNNSCHSLLWSSPSCAWLFKMPPVVFYLHNTVYDLYIPVLVYLLSSSLHPAFLSGSLMSPMPSSTGVIKMHTIHLGGRESP